MRIMMIYNIYYNIMIYNIYYNIIMYGVENRSSKEKEAKDINVIRFMHVYHEFLQYL